MGGHAGVPRLCMALSDWSAQLRILRNTPDVGRAVDVD
jgi:hypothetical protein